jgi:hypothetical protein
VQLRSNVQYPCFGCNRTDIVPSTNGSMGGSCDELTPPLKVVLGLGAFGGSSKSEPSSTTLVAAAGEGYPVAYILGTSYFATPRLGANTGNRRSVLRLNKDGRVPMEDRKGPFDHFRPKSLVLSVS